MGFYPELRTTAPTSPRWRATGQGGRPRLGGARKEQGHRANWGFPPPVRDLRGSLRPATRPGSPALHVRTAHVLPIPPYKRGSVPLRSTPVESLGKGALESVMTSGKAGLVIEVRGCASLAWAGAVRVIRCRVVDQMGTGSLWKYLPPRPRRKEKPTSGEQKQQGRRWFGV